MRHLQRAAQKLLRAFLLRAVENVGRVSLFHDPPVVHEDQPVAHLTGELHLVRDDDHRHSGLGEIAHDDEHLADELGVERGSDLVEENDARLHHQGAGDGHALLLPARKLVRVLLCLVLEPDAGEELERPRLGLAAGHVADPPGRERDVVDRLEVREEVELLEDDPDPLPDLGDLHAFAR